MHHPNCFEKMGSNVVQEPVFSGAYIPLTSENGRPLPERVAAEAGATLDTHGRATRVLFPAAKNGFGPTHWRPIDDHQAVMVTVRVRALPRLLCVAMH